jgi:hypothetical protein
MVVTWGDGVFVDPEQLKDAALTFSYRVGHEGGGFVTRWLETPDHVLTQCRLQRNASSCARYPLSALYQHDTPPGHAFFFQLQASNAAGHVINVNTSPVRLPARSPPQHALVMDVLKTMVTELSTTATPEMKTTTPFDQTSSDPTTSSPDTSSLDNSASASGSTSTLTPTTAQPFVPSERFSGDVDAILQQDEVCAAWRGLDLQQVNVEVGFGTAPGKDDLFSFRPVANVSHFCFNVTSAPVYVKLFSVIKATSSGGSAVFSSDGVVMVPANDSDNNARIFLGSGCHDNAAVGSHVLHPSSTSSLSVGQILNKPLHPGDFLFFQLSPLVNHVTFTDAIVLQTTFSGYQTVVKSPNVTLTLPASTSANVSLQVLSCQKGRPLIGLPADHVTVTWEEQGPWQRWGKWLRLEMTDAACQSVKKGKYSRQQCTVHQARIEAGQREARVPASGLSSSRTYITSLQPCFDHGCLPAFTSDPVTFFHPSTMTLTLNEPRVLDAKDGMLNVTMAATVDAVDKEALDRVSRQPCVVQWTVSRDPHAAVSLTNWAVQRATDCANIQVSVSRCCMFPALLVVLLLLPFGVIVWCC